MSDVRYKDEVDSLTLGQCYDHPKWGEDWCGTSWWQGTAWGVYPAFRSGFVVGREANHKSHVAAARAALATVLEERPQPVQVTEEELSYRIREICGALGRGDSHDVTRLIAEYRVKHSK